jgi:hypothetical protein
VIAKLSALFCDFYAAASKAPRANPALIRMSTRGRGSCRGGSTLNQIPQQAEICLVRLNCTLLNAVGEFGDSRVDRSRAAEPRCLRSD